MNKLAPGLGSPLNPLHLSMSALFLLRHLETTCRRLPSVSSWRQQQGACRTDDDHHDYLTWLFPCPAAAPMPWRPSKQTGEITQDHAALR
jgi:hypothetical protein